MGIFELFLGYGGGGQSGFGLLCEPLGKSTPSRQPTSPLPCGEFNTKLFNDAVVFCDGGFHQSS